MKPKSVFAVHPAGYLVEFTLDEEEHLADAVELLVAREYRPSHGDAWPRTPDGVPICPKHREVMTQREKQGDTWYSHKVTDDHGEVLFCRGYPGKSSPGWEVPARRPVEREVGVGAQTSGAPPATGPRPPMPEEPPQELATSPAAAAVGETMPLPDFRALALAAKTAAEFDYAAYMTLRNGLYTDQERITKTREALVPGWKAGRANGAMLAALEVYREKRSAAEGRGEAAAAAHAFAKREAMNAYNKAVKA